MPALKAFRHVPVLEAAFRKTTLSTKSPRIPTQVGYTFFEFQRSVNCTLPYTDILNFKE